MGHLLLAPRWKMYLIQLLCPPSPFDLQLKSTLLIIVPVDNTFLFYGAHYHSTFFELPYICSPLSMLPVSTSVRLSRFKLSLISSDPPFSISNAIRHLPPWRAWAEQRLPLSPARPWVPLSTACWVSNRLYTFFIPGCRGPRQAS